MVNIIADIFAALVTFPVMTWVLFIVIFNLFLTKRKAFQLATDLSTFLAIIAVYIIIQQIWNISAFWLLLLIILLCGLGFTILVWRIKQELNSGKLFRGIWRLNFLVFMFIYVFLFFYGIAYQVIHV